MKEIFSSDLDKMYTRTLQLLKQHRREGGQEDTDEIFNAHLQGILHTLLDEWSTHNDTVTRWRPTLFTQNGEVFLLEAYDKPSHVKVQVGIHRERVFLEMSLSRPENLLRMADDFWEEWQELHHYGHFEIVETEVFSPEVTRRFPELFTGSMSVLAELMRDMILCPVMNGHPMTPGHLSVTWSPAKYTFTQIRHLGCLVFEKMFRLNARLKKGK